MTQSGCAFGGMTFFWLFTLMCSIILFLISELLQVNRLTLLTWAQTNYPKLIWWISDCNILNSNFAHFYFAVQFVFFVFNLAIGSNLELNFADCRVLSNLDIKKYNAKFPLRLSDKFNRHSLPVFPFHHPFFPILRQRSRLFFWIHRPFSYFV